MQNNVILVTGGAGYIGSHTVLCLLEAGYSPVVVDNYCNSSPESLRRVAKLCGRAIPVVEADLRDSEKLRATFADYQPAAVIHFAGLKAVGESVAQPLDYYACNIGSTLSLLRVMQEFGCRRLVFSSSATVYGSPESLPIAEDAKLGPSNPYGRTKAMAEAIIADLCNAEPEFAAANLRYFNPVGAHASGQIGEDPRGVPNNLMPYIAQVAVGRLPCLEVFGNDWDTVDGTGVRDYIHVMDLAEGHLAALRSIENVSGLQTLNIGTGHGYSVIELLQCFVEVSGQSVPWQVVPRRPGDIAACYADASKAKTALGWSAKRDIQAMCADAWRWQQQYPQGYDS